MTISDPSNAAPRSLSQEVLYAARYYLGSRFGLLAIAAVVLGLGAYSSWGWLVAAGIAPLLLTFAPCAVMCALGMCAMGGKSKNPTDVASAGSVEGTDTKLPLSLTAPGAETDTSSALSQKDKTKPSSGKGCC